MVYSFDPNESSKRERALTLLSGLGDRMVLSTQILQEFYWTATRKLELDPLLAREAVAGYMLGEVISTTPSIVAEGIDLAIVNRIALWDALIIQAAVVGRCARIATEDLNHGQVIRGVEVFNPFLTPL